MTPEDALALAKSFTRKTALEDGAVLIPGPPGQGVPIGGTTGQVLTKASNTNFDTKWAAPSGGGEGGGISPELQEQLEMMILKTSPHLWEPDVEIDFKDGSFGQRFVGTYNSGGGSLGIAVVLFPAVNNRASVALIDGGGWKWIAVIPAVNNIPTQMSTANLVLIDGSGNVGIFQTGSTLSNAPYDIWVIYTKV